MSDLDRRLAIVQRHIDQNRADRKEKLIVKLVEELRRRVPDRADSSLPELEREARELGIDIDRG